VRDLNQLKKGRITMARSHWRVFLGVALLSGCGPETGTVLPEPAILGSGGGIVVTTDRTSYDQGDPVALTIVNQEDRQFGYNPCTRTLQVREGAAWVEGPESFRMCSREISYLGTGATVLDTADLDLGLLPGEYRLVVVFAPGGDPTEEAVPGVTNSFEVK
jgi:hypothetical protein